MAKKSIGLVEQHIEKVVLGAAVLFLLVVVFTYLVTSPNTVDFQNESYGPGQIDLAVRRQAEGLAAKLARRDPLPQDKLGEPNWMDRLRSFENGVIKSNALASAVVPAVPWGPTVPRIRVEKTRQATAGMELARVNPPSRPKVQFERTLAVLQPEPVSLARSPEPSRSRITQDKDLREEDINMVVLEAQFDAARQGELMEAAYREPEFTKVVFADVQVQRRIVLGDQEGEWEDVKPYSESGLPDPPVLKLVGDTALSNESLAALKDYHAQVTSAGVQSRLLTPQGPTRRSGPAGARVREDSDTRRSAIPSLSGRGPLRRDPRSAGYGSDQTADDKAAKPLRFATTQQASKYITETLAKAEEALEKQKFDEAKELAKKVLEAHQIRPGSAMKEQEDRAREILGETKPDRGAPIVGPGREDRLVLIRAFDLTGEPGRTYEYRLRVGVLNLLCLAPARLKDPNDATHPILYGEWSEPSERVTIQEDIYFYLVGEESSGQKARVDVFKWYLGQWVKETFKVEPGQEIGGESKISVDVTGKDDWYLEKVDFSTGAIAIDLGMRVPYQPIHSDPKGYRLSDWSSTTTSLVYMDPDGELRERLASVDTADSRYKDLLSKTKSRPPAGLKERSQPDVQRTGVGRGTIGSGVSERIRRSSARRSTRTGG